MTVRAPRVMQSFSAPRPTTNPYIVMLDRALAAEPGIEHLRFSWRHALTGRVDVIHLHWPEVHLEGDAAWKRLVRRMLMRALIVRVKLSRIAVVRTVHNIELPTGISPATRRLLVALDRLTVHRIVLNETTDLPAGQAATLIPHGHYKDWFAGFGRAARVPGRIGYFGLIRRYKGVETLLDAFETLAEDHPTGTLRIGGRPSSAELGTLVEAAAARDERITATLRFLDDAELVDLATSSQLVVLPYRFMHNSGSVLAALSLDRPVLVPRTATNEALDHEVGEGWVHMFSGDLTAADLADALAATEDPPAASPNLDARDWARTGEAHAAVYRAALATRRRRAVRTDRPS